MAEKEKKGNKKVRWTVPKYEKKKVESKLLA